jgi:hypothetical protein
MEGIRSSQSSFAEFTHLAIDLHRVPLNRSVNPFICEWYGADNLCLKPISSFKSSTVLFKKAVPWSDNMLEGTPCLQMISSYRKFVTSFTRV